MYIYIYVVDMCMYMYVYIYIYIHMHIHVYTVYTCYINCIAFISSRSLGQIIGSALPMP